MAYQVVGRRQSLKYLGILTSSAAGQAFLASWLPAASEAPPSPQRMPGMDGMEGAPPPGSDPQEPYAPQFFKPYEFSTVEALTDLIIPADDKPGAKAAGVARYIDFVVAAASEFRPSLQEAWTHGLALLDESSRQGYSHSFRELSTPQQEALMLRISEPERDPNAAHPGFAFYRLAKEMTVEGFYTSRIGLIDALDYKGLAICSSFPGCTHPEHL